MAIPKKTLKITIWSSNYTSEYVPKRTESRVSKKYLYTRVQGIIHNSPNMEAAQCPPTEECVSKCGGCPQNGVLLSLRKAVSSDIGYRVGESGGHDTKAQSGSHRNTNASWFHLNEVFRPWPGSSVVGVSTCFSQVSGSISSQVIYREGNQWTHQ